MAKNVAKEAEVAAAEAARADKAELKLKREAEAAEKKQASIDKKAQRAEAQAAVAAAKVRPLAVSLSGRLGGLHVVYGAQEARGSKQAKTVQCSGAGCQLRCKADADNDWMGCGNCELWFCPKPGCQGCLAGHEPHCTGDGAES